MRKNILNKIKKIEIVPMSNFDIKEYVKEPIILYSDLNKYNDLSEILNEDKKSVIILYEQNKNNGHWVCISRLNNDIYYFDSYGLEPAAPLCWSKNNNCNLNQTNKLIELFNNYNGNIYYNNIKYQDINNPNQNTCGRFCVLFILFIKKGYTLIDYYKYMENLKKSYNNKYNYSELISAIIQD